MTANASQASSEKDPGAYRSGVAARLAGVPVETLRIWERRYGVVGPRLSPGRQRLYSNADIRRLALIKQLVDRGHPIGAIASLDNATLSTLRAQAGALQPDAASAPAAGSEIRVALVSPLLITERFKETLAGSALRVVARCADASEAPEALAGALADIVVVELATLREPDLERVAAIKTACGATSAIVLYRYAPSAVVRRMRLAGHAVARATSDPHEIETLCLGLARRAGAERAADEPAPPRFDEAALASLAGASRTVECECPRHLVELVMSLGGFERYSAECASRNPADVALHLELQRAAGRARALIEQALERVARAEGFPLAPLAPHA